MIRRAALATLVLGATASGAGEFRRPDVEWGLALADGGRSGCCFGLGVDEKGHSYFTGSFAGGATIQEHSIESAGLHDILLTKLDDAGKCQWAVRAGSTSEDHPVELAVAPGGSCYLVGRIDGTSWFGTKILPYFMETKSFLARYDTEGDCTWVVTARGKLEESVKAVAVDVAGDAIVVGTHVPKRAGATVPTAYLARYAAAGGEKLWVRDIEGTGRSLAVTVDEAGAIYVAGSSGQGSFASKGGPRHPYEKAPLLACFDESGKPRWAWTPDLEDSTKLSGRASAVAPAVGGGCFVGGEIAGRASFGVHEPAPQGAIDGFLARFDPEGACLWATRFGGREDDAVYDVAAAPDGGCVVAGTFRGAKQFAGHHVSSESETLFVAGFDDEGGCDWIRTGAGPGRDPQEAIPFEVAVSPDGGVLVGGWFRKKLELGEIEITGDRDEHFLARLVP